MDKAHLLLRHNHKIRTGRLLSDRQGYFYIFPALAKRDKPLAVPVLKVYESGNGDQLTILRPCLKNKPTCVP
ncbi:MAG: hypothetical protein AAFY11_09600 [Cyanobacteria bacterium J06641_5]